MIFIKKYIGFILFAFLLSCNNASVDNIDRGVGYNYRPGYPELRMASSGFISEENSTNIVVSGDVIYGSLVYAENNESYEAVFIINIEIFENGDDRNKVDGTRFSQVLSSKDSNIINSQDAHSFEKVFDVPPGEYVIEAVITDQKSGRQSQQINYTSIPNPDDEISHITEIRVMAISDDETANSFRPVTTYDVPARYDTLQFIFQVTNTNPDSPLNLETRLLKFDSDTTEARPMNFNSPSQSSIEYKGIEYGDYQTIQTSRRTINQSGSVVIEFKFTDLQSGNYRLEVQSDHAGEQPLYKARDFSVKSEHYPSLQNAKELAKPLVYLMNNKEYEHLLTIEDPVKMKQIIDRFWLEHIGNANIARQVISLYYQRVEEANKMFSNFKEGWKTDAGMMYILFGPPIHVDSFGNEMTWSYSFNRDDPEKNFLFERAKFKNKHFPFDHFILRRSNFYYNLFYQQREAWRTGAILKVNL